jgi:hypothetical protein
MAIGLLPIVRQVVVDESDFLKASALKIGQRLQRSQLGGWGSSPRRPMDVCAYVPLLFLLPNFIETSRPKVAGAPQYSSLNPPCSRVKA